MADASVAINCLEPFQITLNFASQVALDRDLVRIDCVDDGIELLRREIFRAGIRINVGLFKDFRCVARSHAINVWQGSFDAFVAGDIYSK